MSEKPVDEEKAEPKEHDKCMENGDPDAVDGEKSAKKSRMDLLGERAKRITSKKHNVVIILLCIFAFILFITVIALAVRLNSISSANYYTGCASSHCLRAASSVVGYLNKSFDPCTDFWTYSCKGWISQNPIPSHRGSFSVRDQVQANIYQELRHAFDSIPQGISHTAPEWKVTKFFETCMKANEFEFSNNDQELKRRISANGGWTVLDTFVNSYWDRTKILAEMHSEYGVTPYFRIAVEPDDLVHSGNIIKLYPDGLGLPGRAYYYDEKYEKQAGAYKQLMKDVVKLFGATTDKANRFTDSVWNYEKRLAECTPSPSYLKDKTKSYKKLKLLELQQISPVIDWMDVLQKYFPNSKIQEDTTVAIISEEYFRNMSNILSSTDNAVMNAYVMWRFTLSYAQYLSKPFRTELNEFHQVIEGIPSQIQPKEDRYEYCMKLTSKFLGFALGSMYVKTSFSEESRLQVQVMLDRIKNVILKKAGQIPWLSDTATTNIFKQKVKAALSLIGYPEIISNDKLHRHYKELNIQNDFFTNIKEGVRFLRTSMESALQTPQVLEHSWTIYPHEVTAIYNYPRNHLVIGAGLLQYPLYDPNAPIAMRYGSLGAVLTSLLMSAFDDIGLSYGHLGNLQPWVSNSSQKIYNKGKNCLYDQLNKTTYEGVKINANLTVGKMIADIGGVKMAYQAYKDHVSEMGGDENLISIADNDDLFFISYAQAMCEHQRIGRVKSWAEYSSELPNKIGVTKVLQQLPEFADAFKCRKGSPMNPHAKCYLW